MTDTIHIKCGVGIDFGGTSTKLGLVDDHGEVVAQTAFDTKAAGTPDTWIQQVTQEVTQLKADTVGQRGDVVSVGAGVPGFVDYGRGYVYELPNVPGWKDIRLAERLTEALGLPAAVDNDVNAMAMGECKFGAGCLYEHAVCVTLGTGVGGALIINNRLYRGAHFMAGEIGHMSVDSQGLPSEHGIGHLEMYIGNRQIVARTLDALDQGRASSILEAAGGLPEQVTPKIIAEQAQAGDPLALEVFDFVARTLASTLASITYLLQPQVFIVGGGVALSGEILFNPLRTYLKNNLNPAFADRVEVVAATLENRAGMIGSATLGMVAL